MQETDQIHNTTTLLRQFSTALQQPLPGVQAQLSMAPEGVIRDVFTHADRNPVRSSVLILIYLREGRATTLYIRRPEYPGIHSGQMAFPGGRYEEEDTDNRSTALRETEEEIGIARESLLVAGALTPLYIPPSNYIVYPFVAIAQPEPSFIPDPSEVSGIVEVPLSVLMSPGCICHLPPSPEFRFMEVPAYVFDETIVWGATAMITAELISVINQNNLVKELAL